MRRYVFGEAGEALVLAHRVVDHLRRHRQARFWQPEAGGLLFARFEGADVVVEDATGPRRGDRRGRFSYRPDRAAEQREIDTRHANGQHFVGTWHTHPEDAPSPSAVDLASISDIFARSRHGLNAFAMVIAGRRPDGADSYVGLWDGRCMRRLAEAPARAGPTITAGASPRA